MSLGPLPRQCDDPSFQIFHSIQLLLPVFRNMLQYPRQRLRPVLLRPPLRIWQIIVELSLEFCIK